MNKQDEILTILQEECAEVIQAVSKVRRFGMESNQDQLEQEVADLLCMINLMYDNDIIGYDEEKLRQRIKFKEEKLKRYSKIFT